MVEVELRRITINDTGDRQYIVLGEKGGDRMLPIVIGYAEAQAINRFIKGEQMPRPMTHDLALSLIHATDAVMDRIEVTDLKEGTFYAVVHPTRPDGTRVEVDARPSDAIALACAEEKPIFMAESVLKEGV